MNSTSVRTVPGATSRLLCCGLLAASAAFVCPSADGAAPPPVLDAIAAADLRAREDTVLATIDLKLAPSVEFPVRIIAPRSTIAPSGFALADAFGELASAADAGSLSASELIARALRVCEDAYRSEREFEEAAHQLRQNRVLKTPIMKQPMRFDSSVDLEAVLQARLREPFELCRGVSDSLIRDADAWSARAIGLGSVELALEEADRTAVPDEQLALLRAAWSGGDSSALIRIASHMKQRAGSVADGSLVEACAHQLVFVRILEKSLEKSYGPLRAKLLASSRDELTRMQEALDEDQRKEVLIGAIEVLKRSGGRASPL